MVVSARAPKAATQPFLINKEEFYGAIPVLPRDPKPLRQSASTLQATPEQAKRWRAARINFEKMQDEITREAKQQRVSGF